MDDEVVALQRAAQLARQRQPRERVARVAAVGGDPAAARLLDLVHRRVGVAQQRVGVVRIVRVDRDADRGADLELGVGDRKRLQQRRLDLLGDRLGGQPRVAVEVGQQDQELVAALAREQVGRAHDAAQAHRDPPQQLVAGGVAERVVDGLEVVEVDVQQRDRGAGAAGAREAEREVLVEQRAVGQLRERVVVGEEGDLLLRAAALGDVGEGGHDAVGRRLPLAHERMAGDRRPQPRCRRGARA